MPILASVTIALAIVAPANATTKVGVRTHTAAYSPDTTDVLIIPGRSAGTLPYRGFAGYLSGKGYRATVLNLPGYDMRKEAAAIGSAVTHIHQQRPEARVSLVTHSIGALSARWYLKEMSGASQVATYISIGAPQYGFPFGCKESINSEVCPGSPFINQINAGDDTPGPTYYVDLRGEREWLDGHLDGGQCRTTPVTGYQAWLPDWGLDHSLEPLDSRFWALTDTALRGVCAGEFVTEPDGAITAESSLYPYRKEHLSRHR